MQIVISAGSELPIYRQVMRQITDAIAGGRLRPGDKLTSQRELAEQLGRDHGFMMHEVELEVSKDLS